MNMAEPNSLVSKVHYKIVEERRAKRLAKETKGKSWSEVKSDLKQQYF